MKATLEFTLPEEREEFYAANHGMDYRMVIEDVLRLLRDKLKYGELSGPEDAIYERLRQDIYAALDDRGVSVD